MFRFRHPRSRRRPSQPSARLFLEPLETREVPAAVPPSAVEQVFLERLNDARANPPAYGQSIGLDLSNVAPSQPLAFDTRLVGAARGHSQDMNVNNFFSHTGSNGSSPGQRLSAEGYPWQSWAESIAVGYSTPEEALKALIIDAGVPDLGHRVHLLAMNSNMQAMDQVGLGIVQNGTGSHRNYYTIDTAYDADTRPYLTGVAYTDANQNGRYDAGEGLGGVTVAVAGVGSVTTWASGGYSFQVSPNASYTVTASGPGFNVPVTQTVSVGARNARLNFNPSPAPANPEVHVYAGSGELTSGSSTVSFGTTLTGMPVTRVFTVTNKGSQTLTLGSLSVPAGYSVVSGFGSTSLAYNQSTTFTVQMTAAGPGTFTGPISFSTSDPNRPTFSFTATGTAGNVAILDDGDPGVFSDGGWQYAQGPGFAEYYGSDTHFRLGGPGGNPATWSFTTTPGLYRVWATWTSYSNRATDATYTVKDGGLTLNRAVLNQEQAPNDLADAGAFWEALSAHPLTVTGNRLSIELSALGNEYLIADAIRVERIGDLPAPLPAAQIVDNGDPGFSAGTGWLNGQGGGFTEYYGADVHYRLGASGAPPAVWTFTVTPGVYRVMATWTGGTNRATDATWTVKDGATVRGTAVENQELTPADFQEGGSWWADLGDRTWTVTGTTLTVELSGAGNENLIADAVRVQRVDTVQSLPTVQILDDGEAGFTAGAGWLYARGSAYAQYYSSDTHFRLGAAGAPPATWTFSVTPGVYRVWASWTPFSNRATDATYTVKDGGLALARTVFNQEQAPNDLADAGAMWEALSANALTVTGNRLVVELSGAANEYLIADAVRIERVGDLPAPLPPPQVIDDGDAGFSAGSGWSYAQGPSFAEYYNADTTYRLGAAGSPPATWTFSVTPGVYRVSATWTPYSNRATDATYTVKSGATVLGTAILNQQAGPADLLDAGAWWADVGNRTCTVSGTTLTVELSGVANQYLIADAVRILRVGDAPTGTFSETTVASGLASPTAMAFAPDGRLFVTEQGGNLRVIKNGVLLSTPFLTVPVNASGERGLLGVAFDPAFATNGYVYVYYTATSPTIHNRVSRFTANGDVAAAGSEVQILNLETLSATNHNGGAIHFGNDGMLYVAVGDNAVPANAQTLANRLGKMLRIDVRGDDFPGDATRNYAIPTDNPFYTQATGENRAIWALGLRNPYNFAFQPGTGQMFVNDVGQVSWEEINQGVAGANYGWNYSEGFRNPGDTATSIGSYRDPVYAYGHGSGTSLGRAIVGAAFYNPATAQFPSEYVGDYFFADYVNNWISRIDPATGQVSVFDAATAGNPVDLAVGPDGSLYYVARQGGVVNRISYVP